MEDPIRIEEEEVRDWTPPKSTTREPFEERSVKIYHGGEGKKSRKTNRVNNHTWSVGDIDFDPDGSIFIRNPYLANAIEDQIRRNYEKRRQWRDKFRAANDPEKEPFLFRLTRDEGWSGEKQNLVC